MSDSQLPWPVEDFSAYGAVEEKSLGKIQQYVGKVMQRNWSMIPHVTHHDEADITVFEQRRKAWNAEHPDQKRTLLPALMKCAVAMLKEFPQYNCSLSADGATLYQKGYYHIGFAVDVPGGLLVPVVRDCDKKSMDEITAEIVALSEKARGKGLAMQEMSGGCFTLSSLGHIGGTAFTPIINAPEVAILGITRTQQRFVPDADGQPVLRQMLPLSLSYDHRVINGADAARCLTFMASWLADFEFA
ncbi:dihydrolipoamide acetyltransferase [Mangrovimicrobium sediminis]|uniref:Dihydrolipoyllysine-residue acetyltransferase component of pyruvate dehydrogenase complex n=1 Tax=Mangrovimicrobium sediminis TaxID=2562682 RepID=A0A4Z0MA32_9GAMM|nr:2-oxo acid dehydrogenase subunit E2 [Haliea sp. SAOS-164]TGD76257.1 dihydrolipoamide acetyltransferase [Haliea sp. SAOS-164]